MKFHFFYLTSILLFDFALCGCASFSASKSAQINQGLSFQMKAGTTTSPSKETYWFYDIGSDCPLCNSSPIGISEIGLYYGFYPISFGLLLNGTVIQLELYSQLKRREKLAYGIGGRYGLPGGWYSHQIFILFDYQLKNNIKLLINPGLFYHTGQSPNKWNTGSLLFFTQSVGLLIQSDYIDFSPSLSFITGKGKLSIESMPPERKFNDTFVSFSVGIAIHRSK